MRITAVRTTPFTLPLARRLGFAHGAMAETRHVLIEVETDEGITGVGEAISRPYFYGESQRSIVAAVEEWFAPMLVGCDPFDTAVLWRRYAAVQHNNTVKGALDIALHDIRGKALGVPCHKLLGGGDGLARVTYVCGFSAPEEMVQEALRVRETHGIAAFKLKVGVAKEQDGAMLEAMRRALPDATLYVDCNEAYDRHGALEMLARCAGLGIAWAEEPCPARDRAARRAVGAQGAIPVLGDESCRDLGEVWREIGDGNVHMVSIKVARTGFEGSRDIAGLCAAAGVRPMAGSQGDSGIGVLAGGHFCTSNPAMRDLPGELSFHLNLAGDILAEPPVIRDGLLHLPDAPGLGAVIDRAALEHFRNC